jgi:hypothetical protein
MSHWIKAAPKDLYLVQNPEEVGTTLQLAFADKTEPISGRHYMRIAIEKTPIPPGLEADAPPAPDIDPS